MADTFNLKDAYTRRARLTPALIVVLPLGLAVIAVSSDGLKAWTALWSVFVWAGGTALMAQLARDRGKRKEPELFQSWGGKPTTQLLRYRGCENSILVTRRHGALQKAIPDLHLPSEAEERVDPSASDHAYDTCVKWLLEKTRDQKKFPLVFDENCSYGFRRNLWGMKPVAIALAVASVLTGTVVIAIRLYNQSSVSAVSFGALGCIIGLLCFWILWCDPGWVRLAAFAYAERLLASIDAMDIPPAKAANRASTFSSVLPSS